MRYDTKFNAYATGTENQWSTLASAALPGGSINDKDKFNATAMLTGTGQCDVRASLNGVVLFEFTGLVSPTLLDLTVVRDGSMIANFAADIRCSVAVAPIVGAKVGMTWGQQQTLLIEGRADTLGGLLLQWGGVER